ncbi:MAG TPA: ATP-binding protein, partial [Burkholderiaceae bacterium]
MLDSTIAATRRIAADLRPLLLDDLGLVPAIEWLAGNFSSRHGVPCQVLANDELELQEPYATAVFRIVQESLANVGKHAVATQVTIGMEHVGWAIHVVVQDNGRGFDTAAPRKPGSLGLLGLKERADLVNGSVKVLSATGQGTRVEVQIPLEPAGRG